MIEDARWADEGQSIILATIDGKPVQVPADPANRHYQDIVRLGIKIAAFLNPPLTAMDYAQAVSDHIETTAVASEQRTQPEIEAFKSELPQIQWPEG